MQADSVGASTFQNGTFGKFDTHGWQSHPVTDGLATRNLIRHRWAQSILDQYPVPPSRDGPTLAP